LNGIEDVISRADLADRAIFLTLAPIAEEQRRSEAELWREFELARPHILGALLDALAEGLRELPGVRLERLPRMADFALWAAACETSLWPAGTFARAYAANRRVAIEEAIDADLVATCVRELMAERRSWAGSAADLLRTSAEHSRDGIGSDRPGWPQNPRALAGRLRRAPPCVRSASRSPLAVRATPAAGSSEYMRARDIPSAASAWETGPQFFASRQR
jgi:hypothetical protein